MTKLVTLLNESTILDLKMFGMLSKRYKIHFAFAGVLFAVLCSYNFFSQPVISEKSVPMKVVSDHRVSSDISSLLPVENGKMLNIEELNISLNSKSFLKFVSGMLVKNNKFDSLNFGNSAGKKAIPGYELKKLCNGNFDCVVNELSEVVNKLFIIEKGPTTDRFVLKINAVDKTTTNVLVDTLVKAIDQERVKNLRYSVLKEIESVGNLVQESRSIIEKSRGYEALEAQERIQNNILDLKEKIRMLQNNMSIEMVVFNSLQAKISENKKAAQKIFISKEAYDGYMKIQARLNEIRSNLNSLTNLPEANRSISDNAFISYLHAERARLLNKLPEEKNLKVMELKDSFANKQRESFNDFEFEFLVSKNKIAKLESDFEATKSELNAQMQQKILNESRVNGMKTDLEFLKNLETKQSSLKLLSATMNSDLIFEVSNGQSEEFRKFAFTKILLFSFFFTLFLYTISLVIRYCTDDKIYGESEIKLYFKNLDFVGEVPSFES